jgi:membrane-bound serine protease (ClpP class)
MRPKTIIGLLILGLVLWLCVIPAGHSESDQPVVYIITIADAIGPGIAQHLSSGIKKATEAGAECLILALDTPGGLAESMRAMVQTIYASNIPVVVYVSPSGARAASAGVMITMAADIAAMAPGTNIGAAHPVGAGGQEINETMSDKVVNDMVAFAKSIADRRGRNGEWAEKAVRESVSITAAEALEENVIDVVAQDVDDLIRQINGREIEGRDRLALDDARQVEFKESMRTKILKTISNPNIAYILMMIGLAGLYFELSHPGAIFPGVIGGIALILAFFAFQALPVNYAGILLIILAIVLFIMEMKITSYGLLSIAGVICLFLGSLMMFEGSTPEMRLSWRVFLPTVGLISAFFVLVAGLAFRAQVAKPRTGASGLIGEIGVVRQSLAPEGKVLVHGELWQASSTKPLEEGTRVRVAKVEGLHIEVEPMDEEQVS